MCGIIAIFCKGQTTFIKEFIAGHLLLTNRGPDCGSLIINSQDCLGFRRLSINDTSPSGNQPFKLNDPQSGSSIKLMCNGEIYNHKELVREYGIHCESGSDCEVLIHLYKKFGFVEMVGMLDGVFAIVLVDGDKVYLARDRIGVRPLYTGWTFRSFSGKRKAALAVASTPNSLISFCCNIEQLPPSSILLYSKMTGEMETFSHSPILKHNHNNILFWSPSSDKSFLLHQLLNEAVEKRLMTDRPMGCFLSGGLDSSIIASILVEKLGGKNVGGRTSPSESGRALLRTYSVGMEGATDLKYARMVADRLGTVHTEVIFTPEEAFEVLPEVIKDIGSYDVTTVRASVGMWLLARYVKENSKDIVIFSGEGSDELLMGYLYFHNAPTPSAAQEESERLVNELANYDVLRADRCVSSHGLELRVPFLDRYVVDFCMSLDPEEKIPKNGFEKFLLRKAFERSDLPLEVLWRRKEGMSDGTGSLERPLSVCFQERLNSDIPENIPENIPKNLRWTHTLMHNLLKNTTVTFGGCEVPIFPTFISPVEQEAKHYRKLFDEAFPGYQPVIDRWLPRWTDTKDPSGRLISIKTNESVVKK